MKTHNIQILKTKLFCCKRLHDTMKQILYNLKDGHTYEYTCMFNDYSTFFFIFLIFQIIQQYQIRQVVLYKMKKKKKLVQVVAKAKTKTKYSIEKKQETVTLGI